MKRFKDKVAVITGAANGIGRGLAFRAVHEGMKVVLADIEKQSLTKTGQELQAVGGNILTIRTDVSKYYDPRRRGSCLGSIKGCQIFRLVPGPDC